MKPIGIISSRDIACNFVEAIDAATDVHLEGTLQNVFDRLARKEPQDIWVQEDDTVYDALMKMANKRVGALLVHSGTTFAGIFTERDYLNRIILKGRSSRQTTVKEVMSPEVQYIHMDTPIRECLDIAITKKFRHIPIVSLLGKEINDRDLVGMLTINDIVSFFMFELELRRLKHVSPDLH
jgi:CBS domain-containing protein